MAELGPRIVDKGLASDLAWWRGGGFEILRSCSAVRQEAMLGAKRAWRFRARPWMAG